VRQGRARRRWPPNPAPSNKSGHLMRQRQAEKNQQVRRQPKLTTAFGPAEAPAYVVILANPGGFGAPAVAHCAALNHRESGAQATRIN